MSRILNLARLNKKLSRLPPVAKEYIRSEMAKGADQIVALMRSLVPKGATGRLEASIGWSWGARAPKGSLVLATLKGSGFGGDLTLTIYAGNNEAFYARFQEFGTIKMAASPFFYVSYRANRKSVKSRIRRAITKAAKKVAKGG